MEASGGKFREGFKTGARIGYVTGGIGGGIGASQGSYGLSEGSGIGKALMSKVILSGIITVGALLPLGIYEVEYKKGN